MLREIFREIPIETISNTIEVCYSKQPSQNLKGLLKKEKCKKAWILVHSERSEAK